MFTDDNECSPLDPNAASPCVNSADCKNEIGTFTCVCGTGYDGNGRIDGTGCSNINECVAASSEYGQMNPNVA